MLLILGASSFIGRHLYEAVGPSGAIGTHCGHPVAGSVHFDVTRMRLEEVVPRPEQISHAVVCFAEAKIDACKADRTRSEELNVRRTIAVLDALIRMRITPVFLSSEYVFDGERGRYAETDAPHPTTVYGAQKRAVERHLEAAGEGFVVLRLAKVFGTDPDDGTILASWLGQIRRGEAIRAARDQVFSPIHVRDVVAIIQAVIRRGLRGMFHVGNPEPWSRLSLLQALLRYVDAEARVIECGLRDLVFLDHRPLDLSLNPRKVLDATGVTVRGVSSCCEEIARRAGLLRPGVVEVSP